MKSQAGDLSPDPLDVLERIHRDVKLLGELAGPALKVTIEAVVPEAAMAPAYAKRAHVVRARERGELVFEYLLEHGPTRQADLAVAMGVQPSTLIAVLRRLGDRVVKGPGRRAPGQTTGRASPVWRVAGTPQPSYAQTSDAEAEQPAAADEEPATGAETPDAEVPLEDAADASEEAAIEDGHHEQGEGAAALAAAPEPDEPIGKLSPRTRKSIERAQEEARAAEALGPPPASRVLDILRERAATSRELAAALGTRQVFVDEEIHALKPWLIKLHDGKWRAIERLRLRADAA